MLSNPESPVNTQLSGLLYVKFAYRKKGERDEKVLCPVPVDHTVHGFVFTLQEYRKRPQVPGLGLHAGSNGKKSVKPLRSPAVKVPVKEQECLLSFLEITQCEGISRACQLSETGSSQLLLNSTRSCTILLKTIVLSFTFPSDSSFSNSFIVHETILSPSR